MATRLNTLHFPCGDVVSSTHAIGKCWVQTGGVWTNETTDVNSSATADVPMGGEIGDEVYYGTADISAALCFITSTAPTGTVVWEYWNGSTWASWTGASGLPTNTTTIGTGMPADAAATQVNGEVDGPWFYVRQRRTGAGTGGTLSSVCAGPALRVAAAKPIEIVDMVGSPQIRHAVLRLRLGSSILAALERLYVRGRWDSTAYSDLLTPWATTNNFTHSESWTHVVDIDVTAITQTAWATGSTHNLDLFVQMVGRGVTGSTFISWACGELIITYDQDDTAATQMRTVIFPSDALTGALTTSHQTIGSTPDLSTVLPESGKTIVENYVEVIANSNEGGTTDWTLYYQIDTAGEVTMATFDAAADSDWYLSLIQRPAFSASASEAFKLRVSATNGAAPVHAGFLHKVTYKFTPPTAGQTAIHTMVMPHGLAAAFGSGTAADDRTVYTLPFWIEDTAPTLVRAGVLVWTHQTADPGNMLLAAGGQTARSYSMPPTNTSGPVPVMQRIDAGGAAGAGFTFGRGLNEITYHLRYDTAPTSCGGVNGVTYLTYTYTVTAGKRPSCCLLPVIAATTSTVWAQGLRRVGSGFQWAIPEASYFFSALAAEIIDNGSDVYSGAAVRVRRGAGLGWAAFGFALNVIDAGAGVRMSADRICDLVLRYPGQPAGQYEINPVAASLSVTIDTPNDRIATAIAWGCWHDYTWTVADSVSGSDAGTVTIALHDALTGDLLKTTTRAGDGAYSFSWYDNTRDVYTVATDATGNTARSEDGVAL